MPAYAVHLGSIAPCSWIQPWPGSVLPEPAQAPPSADAQLEPIRLQVQEGFILPCQCAVWLCRPEQPCTRSAHPRMLRRNKPTPRVTQEHVKWKCGWGGSPARQHDGQGQGLPACPVPWQSAKGHTGLGLSGGTSVPLLVSRTGEDGMTTAGTNTSLCSTHTT